jgi:hypothetical protein
VAARGVAATIAAADPDLSEHPRLAEEVRRLDESEQADFLGKA